MQVWVALEQEIFWGLSDPGPKRLNAPSLIDFRGKNRNSGLVPGNRDPKSRGESGPQTCLFIELCWPGVDPSSRTLSTVVWVHKELPQSNVNPVPPSTKTYESTTGSDHNPCNWLQSQNEFPRKRVHQVKMEYSNLISTQFPQGLQAWNSQHLKCNNNYHPRCNGYKWKSGDLFSLSLSWWKRRINSTRLSFAYAFIMIMLGAHKPQQQATLTKNNQNPRLSFAFAFATQ